MALTTTLIQKVFADVDGRCLLGKGESLQWRGAAVVLLLLWFSFVFHFWTQLMIAIELLKS